MTRHTAQAMADASRDALNEAIANTVSIMRRYADEIERDCARTSIPANRASAALAGIGNMMTNIDMRGIAYWAACEARDTAEAQAAAATTGKGDA
jgi:hypothetical protein